MKKHISKIVALAMSVLMVLTLGACGGKTDNESAVSGIIGEFDDEKGNGITSSGTQTSGSKGGTNSVSSGTVGETTITSEVDLSGKDPFANIPSRLRGTTVTFAHFGDEGSSEYQKVINAFTAKTGIKVKLIPYDQDTYVSTVAQQIVARSAPDVIICNEIFPHGLEIAQPIQKLLDLNDDFWDKNVTNMTTINGNTYYLNSLNGVWHNIDMCFYNEKLFKDNNITSPGDYYKRGQWTYENLRKCLEQVVKAGKVGGFVDPKMMAASIGAPLVSFDAKTGKFSQNLTKAVSAFQYCATNIENKLWDIALWHRNFENGTIGLYIQSAYGAKYNGWFSGIDKSIINAVPTPQSYQGKACKQSESIRAYGISRGSKNPEGAAYFLRWFLDYSNYKSAGANVFLNDKLENAYFETLNRASKEGISYYFNRAIYDYTTVTENDIKHIAEAPSAQASGKLASYTNEFDAGVKKLNEKIKSIT